MLVRIHKWRLRQTEWRQGHEASTSLVTRLKRMQHRAACCWSTVVLLFSLLYYISIPCKLLCCAMFTKRGRHTRKWVPGTLTIVQAHRQTLAVSVHIQQLQADKVVAWSMVGADGHLAGLRERLVLRDVHAKQHGGVDVQCLAAVIHQIVFWRESNDRVKWL